MSSLWTVLSRLGLAYHLHPLVKGAQRRRRRFDSAEAMFTNYRQKRVFQRMSDESLSAYVQAMAEPLEGGQIGLRYPPEWEARIYVTGMLADRELWQALPELKIPTLLLRGVDTDTFWARTAVQFAKRAPEVELVSVPGAGHLLPLEKPPETNAEMQKFLASQH
jgi:pimeloyl-ACP methyl ester carboxylesterase